jgi:hypothetical protein
MLQERHGAKLATTVTDDPRHDDDAPTRRSGGQGQRRLPSRPKVERFPPLRFNVWPGWPAFFTARITSPAKLFGRLARWLP